MKSFIVASLCLCGFLFSVSQAQQSTPPMLVVQAASAQATPPPAVKPTTNASDASIMDALKCLQETKTANAEILKKQEEALQQLDDLQKASDQLRIFSKRSGG